MSDADLNSAVSNRRIMRALIAKDWRFFRVPMIGLVAAGLGAYLLSFRFGSDPDGFVFAFVITRGTCAGALAATAILGSAFGGFAIARERADRTGEFLEMLPVSRWQIVLSKWIVIGTMLLAAAVIHGLIALASWSAASWQEILDAFATGAMLWAISTVSFFGLAWLFSSFAGSAVISACSSIAIIVALVPLFTMGMHYMDVAMVAEAISVPMLLLGLLSVLAGTLHYLGRVAP